MLIFWVGLFKISIFGLMLIYLVIIIFCWFFFDKLFVFVLDDLVLIVKCLISKFINCCLFFCLIKFFGEKLNRFGSVIFFWIEKFRMSFFVLWFFVMNLRFNLMVWLGFVILICLLFNIILFFFNGLSLKIVCIILVLLVFISFVILIIFFDCIEKWMFWNIFFFFKFFVLNIMFFLGDVLVGNWFVSFFFIILWIILLKLVSGIGFLFIVCLLCMIVMEL